MALAQDPSDIDVVPSGQGSRTYRANKRKEALKAKNRRAQARYRSRQKEKFTDYKTAIDDLTEQLDKLSAEKDALAADKAMLESCLQLSYQKGLTCPSSAEGLELVSPSAETYQQAIWKTARVDGPLLDAMLSVFARARKACGLPPLSREEVANTMLHEVFNRKEMCVQGIAALLSKLDAEGSQEAFEELVDFMKEQAVMFNLLYTQHGQLARVMEAAHVQTCRAKFGQASASFWVEVADALALTEQQQKRMLHLRRELLARMEDVRQKRVAVLNSIKGTLPTNINCDANGNSFAGTFVQGTHSVDLLRQSLHQEHCTTHEFAKAIRKTVLSPYQHAVLEVRSFPHKVDLLAICDVIGTQSKPSEPALTLDLDRAHSGLRLLDQMGSADLSPLDPSAPIPSAHMSATPFLPMAQGAPSTIPMTHAAVSEPQAAQSWPPSSSSEPLHLTSSDPLHLGTRDTSGTCPPHMGSVSEGAGEADEVGSLAMGSPRFSLKMRNSEMDALLLDL
ncbi:hypothetical protein WJX73_006125 [Symbiochloris irregularis]|uniref:BZIP domain-containing protein n=1 Tax=Symbiochloris irregularis TaxID=706552 RepID=A0AAW1NRW2_9CHLO